MLIRKIADDGSEQGLPVGTICVVPEDWAFPPGWERVPTLDESVAEERTPVGDAVDDLARAFGASSPTTDSTSTNDGAIEVPVLRSRGLAGVPRIGNLPPSLRTPEGTMALLESRGVSLALTTDLQRVRVFPSSGVSGVLRTALMRHAGPIRRVLLTRRGVARSVARLADANEVPMRSTRGRFREPEPEPVAVVVGPRRIVRL